MVKKLLVLLLSSSFLSAAIHYEGASSENFIIRWEFQNLCDHAFDPLNDYGICPANEGKREIFDPADVRPGDLIFVRDFKKFYKSMHHKIQVPYFILTHGEFRDRFREKFLRYLDDEKILAWLTIHPIAIKHERVIPLPLGVVQHKDIHGNKKKMFHRFMKLRDLPKDGLLYMNFTEWCMPFRTKIREYFETKPFCTYAKRVPFEQFMTELASHKFALSPPGLGPDCYRVWECAMLGTIPIVEHSHMDFMYDGLPVLFINDWKEVTQEFLEQKYKEITAQTYSQEKLFMEYWIDLIDEARKKYWPPQAGAFRPLGG